jgi:hypothetical protein
MEQTRKIIKPEDLSVERCSQIPGCERILGFLGFFALGVAKTDGSGD